MGRHTTGMNEIPVASTSFRYSIPTDTFNPVKEGAWLGAKTALFCSCWYALCIVTFIFLQESDKLFTINIRDIGAVGLFIVSFYLGVVFLTALFCIIGAIPAVIIGTIGGAMIGVTFHFIPRKFTPIQAMLCSFGLSLFSLTIRIGVVHSWLKIDFFWDIETNMVIWGVWFLPNLIAFFGLWWVAYKVNQKIPSP